MATQKTKQASDLDEKIPGVTSPDAQQLATITPEEAAAAHEAAAQTRANNEAHLQNFMNWLAEEASSDDEDQYAMMASIMGEIMNAENPAEVMAEKQTLSAKEVIGRPFLLHAFVIRQGDYEESLFQHYAALTVSPPGSDVTRVLTTGASKILMKLYALSRFNEWPQPIMFTSKPGKKGDILDIISY